PLPFPGFQIDTDEAFREQIVAGSLSAVVIGGGRFHRKVDQPELFVDRRVCPHARVARYGPRIVLPGLTPELTWSRDRVECPKLFAGACVERANQPFRIVVSR